MGKEKTRELDKLKKEYEKLRKKHNLPSFNELNKDFSIERVCEIETDFLLKEVRKSMADKIFDYLRFVETLLHPINAPMFYFSILKTLNNEDKKILGETYKELVESEIDFLEVDLEYSEEQEAKAIKKSYEKWQNVKKNLLRIINTVKKNWGSKFEPSSNNKGYFG